MERMTGLDSRAAALGHSVPLLLLAHKKGKKNGADDGARTRYLHLGKVALYQMSYIRIGSEEILFACLVPPVGIEPTTRGFSVLCSTN